MADIRLIEIATPDAVTMDLLLTPIGELDTGEELATAVRVAIGTDRRAEPDDELPGFNDEDRRGWWGDTDAAEIWGGWPIGSRLWLLHRAKITERGYRLGATRVRAEGYIREALQPFIDNDICSDIAVQGVRSATDRIGVDVTMYRGPLPDIQLRFVSLWDGVKG